MHAVASQVGVSIQVPKAAKMDDLITADYNNLEAQKVFENLANRIEMVAEYEDGMVTFQTLDKAHRDFVVLRSGYAETELVQRSIQSMLGESSVVDAIDDRVVITSHRKGLQQAVEYSKHFQQGQDGWLLDVRVVSITKVMRRELGLDWNMEANLGLDTRGAGYLTNADLLVNVIGKATETGTDAQLLQTATLYVLEGSESQITQGQKIPVPKKQTSPEGTTTTTGYEYIEAGFKLVANAKRVPGGVRLNLQPTISSVAGFVEEAPITQESSAVVQVVVDSGEWIVITGLDTTSESKDTKKIPGLPAPVFGTNTGNQEQTALLVLVQAKRVFAAQAP